MAREKIELLGRCAGYLICRSGDGRNYIIAAANKDGEPDSNSYRYYQTMHGLSLSLLDLMIDDTPDHSTCMDLVAAIEKARDQVTEVIAAVEQGVVA